MTVVVAAASTKSSEFAVIDFTEAPPRTVMVDASSAGNVVDCYGTLTAVGDCGSGTVALYDVSNPESPARVGSIDTRVASVKAISIDGTYVLAGGPAQVVLIDIADPTKPSIVSVYSDSGLNAVCGVAIRGTNAIVCQTDAFYVIDYKHPARPTPVQYYGPQGPVMGDFDGTHAAFASSEPTVAAPSQNISVYRIAGGGIATALRSIDNDSTLASVAIAAIPEGGYYVAMGLPNSSFDIKCFPLEMQNQNLFTSPLLPPAGSQGLVAVRFLNNPAIPPYLAAANVTSEHGFFVTCNFLFFESDGRHATIQLGKPIPVAKVALAATNNPTLGITAFESPVGPPWHFPWLPWPLPPRMRR
jgi:hypothetical protein